MQLPPSPGLPLRLLDPVERSPEFGFLDRLSFPRRTFGRGGIGLLPTACHRRASFYLVLLPPTAFDAIAHPEARADDPELWMARASGTGDTGGARVLLRYSAARCPGTAVRLCPPRARMSSSGASGPRWARLLLRLAPLVSRLARECSRAKKDGACLLRGAAWRSL